jgi:nitronate monooxygenase
VRVGDARPGGDQRPARAKGQSAPLDGDLCRPADLHEAIQDYVTGRIHKARRGITKRGRDAEASGADTEEGDAHPEFKRVLAGAGPQDIVEFTSVAGLPARAVLTPWLRNYLRLAPRLQAKAAARGAKPCTMAFDCLAQCGLRDGIARIGQFCIDNQLAAALRGDVKAGLFFRGAGQLPFGSQIRPVRELIDYLLTGALPAAIAALAPAPAALGEAAPAT